MGVILGSNRYNLYCYHAGGWPWRHREGIEAPEHRRNASPQARGDTRPLPASDTRSDTSFQANLLDRLRDRSIDWIS